MAKLVQIEVSLGTTVCKDGVYIKPQARAVIDIESTDTTEARERIWLQAWKLVEEQVSNQLKNLL